MTETEVGVHPRAEELDGLARKYLDLWLEHWAAMLAAPETAALMGRFFSTPTAPAGGGFDIPFAWPWPGAQPASVRTAHDAGDKRVDQLERRVAELERRLAERGSGGAEPAPPRTPRRSGGRARKV